MVLEGGWFSDVDANTLGGDDGLVLEEEVQSLDDDLVGFGYTFVEVRTISQWTYAVALHL